MAINFWEILTEAEKNAVSRKSARIRWGFTPQSIREELTAYKEGDIKAKAKVCALLEDCNFHTLCEYLSNGDVAAAEKWCDDKLPLV